MTHKSKHFCLSFACPHVKCITPQHGAIKALVCRCSIVCVSGAAWCRRLHARRGWLVSAANCLVSFLMRFRRITSQPSDDTAWLCYICARRNFFFFLFQSATDGALNKRLSQSVHSTPIHPHGSLLNWALVCLERTRNSIISAVSTRPTVISRFELFSVLGKLFFPAPRIIIGWAQQQSTSF